VLVLLLIVSMFMVGAASDTPDAGVGAADVEGIKGAIEDFSPLDESGEVDVEKYKPFQDNATKRIEAINEYVGPVTNVLFGVELSLSWVFIFAFIMWILLIELIIVPVSSIFDWNIWMSLVGAGIIATLAMQGFGKDFIIWIESLMTQWWIGFIVLFGAVIFGIVYSVFFKYIGAKAKKAREKAEEDQTKRDRKVIALHAKLAKHELEN